MALFRIQCEGLYQVACLLATVSEQFHRVSMHGVREELLDMQAESVGYQIEKVMIPYPCTNRVYEERMNSAMTTWKAKGVTHAIFGDLFLEDIRKYREEKLSKVGIQPIFPVWGSDTKVLAEEMLRVGFKAVVTCIDPTKLNASFVGREFDESFLADLPHGVDPCGENGEFHSFVYDGPVFKRAIRIKIGERVLRDNFWFADVTAFD